MKSIKKAVSRVGRFVRNLSLRGALVIYVLVPMAVAAAFVGLWSLQAFERQVEKRMQKDLELVARAIKQPLGHAIQREREGSISQALESAFSIGRVYGAYVYDAEGNKISTTGRREPKSQPEEVSRLAEGGEQRGEYGEVAGRDVYSYFVPLTDSGGRITGLLQLTRRRSDFQEQIRDIRYKAVFIFILAFTGLTCVVFYGHHRALGKHLNRLSKTMTRISKGERKQRFSPGGPREILALGVHFNQMMDNIDQAEQEIQRRRAEQEELEKRLRQAEKLAAIGQLSAGVAHELGTPLSVIEGKAQRALRSPDMPAPAADNIQAIRSQARRMEQIIRQLLDFSRRSELRPRRVKMSQLARSAAAALEPECKRLDAGIVLEGRDTHEMEADSVQMEQALANLMKNAAQAAPGGQVRVSWERREDRAVFCVEDSGSGIDETKRKKLFEPFFTTKAVGAGTGLGLAVVHGIVEAHGGEIQVGNSSMGGACFTLLLPAAVPVAAPGETKDE
ncbi:MAG: sensor histidine kinase [Desulfosalsimonas sp.]|uniref:HAMP domain-containing sensor histidine kinase n=1 Tax=Desulfosalsimonas sp. TaxID=3073848 RepID=UPI003970F8A3